MKKIFYFFIILIIPFFFIKYHVSNNTEFFKKYKNSIPREHRASIRRVLVKATNLIFNKKKNYIFVKKKTILSKNNLNKKLTFYNNPLLNFLGPRAYFSSNNKNLFLITGTGVLLTANIDEINSDLSELEFKTIETNIDNYLAEYKKETDVFITSTVKDVLVREDKIFISIIQKFRDKYNYNTKKKDECFKHAILKGDLSLNKIDLNNFFIIDECRHAYNDFVGGTLSDFKDNKILYTVGDFGVCERPNYISENNTKYCEKNNAQVMTSALGKIFEIDVKNKFSNIISLGHDNPQGLYYDKINDIIFSTEHGPMGGDEININKFPSKDDLKNFGYPISSYGEHYGFPDPGSLYLYKLAPLYKSHKKYGFIEPVKYFVPSIGISPVIVYKNKLLVGSLGNDVDEGDLSLHTYDINQKFELSNHNIFPFDQRIRDIHVINKTNQILLYLETNGSIVIME